jgi:hypothetical protein
MDPLAHPPERMISSDAHGEKFLVSSFLFENMTHKEQSESLRQSSNITVSQHALFTLDHAGDPRAVVKGRGHLGLAREGA